jgi:radical SAM-linked protein
MQHAGGNNMRAIIKYARSGAASFISHLDMQRAFARALRRAELPVQYSEGFNPHILTSFAAPLSVGIATEGDYLEVRMAENCTGEEIRDALNAVMPQDLRIVSAGELDENCPKLMAIGHSARYELAFEKEPEALGVFMENGPCVVLDRKSREVDLRALVIDLNARGRTVLAQVANSSAAALNPIVLAHFLSGGDARITRLECFCLAGGQVIPYEKLGK